MDIKARAGNTKGSRVATVTIPGTGDVNEDQAVYGKDIQDYAWRSFIRDRYASLVTAAMKDNPRRSDASLQKVIDEAGLLKVPSRGMSTSEKFLAAYGKLSKAEKAAVNAATNGAASPA